jgi:hypothetical protein
MAHTDSIHFPPGAGVPGSREGTIAIILRAAKLGLYTAAEARLLIDEVRTQASTQPATPQPRPGRPSGSPAVPGGRDVGVDMRVDGDQVVDVQELGMVGMEMPTGCDVRPTELAQISAMASAFQPPSR